MGLVDFAHRQKAEPGAERPKGPAPTPPEMLQEAQQMTTAAGPEVAAQLALMARHDPGNYTQQLESIKAQFGAATADILHADVQARLANRPEGQNPPDGMTAEPERKEPDTIAQTMMDKMAGAVGVDPQAAQEAAEQAQNADPSGPSPGERAEAQEQAAEGTAGELLRDMGNSPGVPSDKVPIKVDGEALAKTEAAGAEGMVQDGLVYLHPDEYNPASPEGQRLVAEETVHWVQQQHALTGGGAEQSPMPAVEREAQSIAAAYVAGEQVPAPREVMGPNDVAYSGGEAGGVEPPTDFTFNLGGASITVAMPPEPGKQLTLQIGQSPIPGVTLQSANILFDDNWEVQNGTVSASINAGSYVTMDQVNLTVSRTGAVQANIDGAALKVGDLISGTISLNLSSEGITGTATVNHEQVTLPLGVVLQQGFLRVSLDSGGNISAVGNLMFDLPGLGTVTVNASIDNETIGGTASLVVSNPIPLAGGVTLVEASLSGNYTRDGFTISGSSLVNVNDWAEAHIAGTFEFPSMSWSANGRVVQKQNPMTLGGIDVSNGQLSVVLDHGNLVEVGGGADFSTQYFAGSLGGTYDVAKQSFTGSGRADLTQDLPLGSVGTLKSASGTATIEDNALKSLTGQAQAEVNFEGQPTFEVTASDVSYDVEAGNLSGSGRVTLMRDLSFQAAGLTATVSAGASAGVTVTDNAVTEVTGGLSYQVTDQMGELGGGTIDLTFNGDSVSGSGTFALAQDYGFPDRAAGPAYLLQGSGLTVTVENNVPTAVTLDNVLFAVKNLGSDQSGELQGSAEGSIDLATFQMTGSASMSVSSPWTQTTTFGDFTLREGTVNAAVAGGELDMLEAVGVKMDAHVTAGQYALNLEATLNGTYSAKSNEASGTLDVVLVDSVGISMGTMGELTVRGQETRGSATLAANQLTEITFSMGVDYKHDAGLALTGSIPDGRVDVAAGEVSGTGTLSLAAPLTEETDFGEFSLLSGTVIASVEANALTKVELQGVALSAKLDVGDKTISLGGSVSGQYNADAREVSGEMSVTLQEALEFDVGDGKLTVQPNVTTGKLTLAANQLTGATFGLEIEYAHNSGAKLIGRFENGSLDTSAGTVSGDGTLELAAAIDVPVPGSSWTLKLPAGAKVQASVVANSVQQITSESLAFEIHNENGLLVTGGLTNAVLDLDKLEFSGVASAQVPAEQDLGFESAGYSFFLTPCSVTATLEKSDLKEISGAVGIKATKGEGSITAALASGSAVKTGADWVINGTGIASVEGTIEIGGAGGYTFLLRGGTGISIEMVNNDLTKVEGDLNALVKDSEGDFLGLTCKVTYKAAEGGTIDANGSCSLLGDRLLLEGGGYQFHLLANGTGANVVIVANELQEVGGSIGCKVVRTDNNLQIGGSAQGKWVRGEGAGSFSGSGDLKLLENILINGPGGFKFDFLAGSGGNASVADNELTELGGTLKCNIHDQQGPLVHLECGGKYDAVNNKVVEASGQANMLRPIELMGGKIKVLNLNGTAEIENNELVAAGGSANLEVEGFDKVEGSIEVNWSNRSGVDEYEGKATLKVQVNEKIGGSLEVELKKGGGFSVTGNVELKITDKIKGEVGFRMDETFDPALDGTITVEGVELLPGRELFGMEIPIVPNITIGPFYGINIVMGCGAGMKADMRPVTFGASIGVRDWHPKNPTDVPDFEATASVSAGLDFIAGIKPYIGVSGGVAGAQAGIAVEGELRVTIPVELSPKLTLRGGPSGFGGEFAFGVSVTPSLSIIVRPFLFAELAGKMARHDLTEWTFPLGTLFTWEWNKTYQFGDQGPSSSAGGADVTPADGGTPQQSFAQNESADMSEFKGSGGGGGGNGKDSPQLESGNEFAQANGGDGGGGGEMAEKLNSLKEKAEMLARIADLFTTVSDILAIATMSGPFAAVGIAAYIAYRVYIKEDLTLDSFVQSLKDLWNLIVSGAEWLMANLPDWVKDVYDWVASGAKNIILDMQEWFTNNLKELGQAALDFAADAGEWGKSVIQGAGKWAAEAVGWAWDTISDAGEAIGDAWSSGVDYVSSWF